MRPVIATDFIRRTLTEAFWAALCPPEAQLMARLEGRPARVLNCIAYDVGGVLLGSMNTTARLCDGVVMGGVVTIPITAPGQLAHVAVCRIMDDTEIVRYVPDSPLHLGISDSLTLENILIDVFVVAQRMQRMH